MNSPTPPTKRLSFDRRYGWVLDEWKEPSQEALSGGRGMFCIVPLAKAVLKMTSDTMNCVANTTLDVLQRPDAFSPKVVQATLGDQMRKMASSTKEFGACLDRMAAKRSIKWESKSASGS